MSLCRCGENRFRFVDRCSLVSGRNQYPSGFSAGDSNLYRFVGNHPTYATDPTGLYEGGNANTSGNAGIPTVTTYGSGTVDALAGGGSYGGGGGGGAITGAITGPTAGPISPGLYAGLAGSGGSYGGGLGGGLGASAAANSFGQLNAGNNTLSFMEPGGGPGMGAIANSLGNMAMPSSLTSGGNGSARLLPPPAAGIAMQSRAGPYAKVLPGNPAAIKRGSCRFNISGWSIHQKGKEAQSR